MLARGNHPPTGGSEIGWRPTSPHPGTALGSDQSHIRWNLPAPSDRRPPRAEARAPGGWCGWPPRAAR